MTANYPVLVFFSRRLATVGMISMLMAMGVSGLAQPAKKIDWVDSAKNYSDRAKYDSALILLSRGLQAYTSAKDSAAVAHSFYQTGLIYGLQSKYKESIIAEQKAFVIYQKKGINDGAINALLSLGYSNFKLKKYPDAKQLYNQALERAQRNSAFEQMVEAYDGLANVYEAQKDFKKAISSVRFMQGAYDSIVNRDHKKKFKDLAEKYSTLLEEKDRQLVEAEAQHRQMKTDRLLRLIERDDIRLTFYSVALALIFVVLCLSIAWLITQRKAKIAETLLSREQAGIKTANEQFEIISQQIHNELTGNLNVEYMMDMVWLINPNSRSLESLITYIRDRTNALLKPLGINYMIVVPDRIPNMQLMSLERVNLYFVTRELIRYAVDCSKATGLTLSITLEGRQLIFKVKDSSVPVDEAKVKKRGEELKPLRERMEQIDGTIGLVMEQGAMVVIYRKDLK